MKKSTELLEDWMSLIGKQRAVIKAEPRPDSPDGHWGKWISDLIGRTQEYLDGNKDISPYNPAHGEFYNCCGIFCHINDEGILCCNECGASINELIDGIISKQKNAIKQTMEQLEMCKKVLNSTT